MRAGRWRLPARDDMRDRRIGGLLWPSVANLMVVPLTGAIDTFWVGRIGDALALAGLGAANQLFGALFFLMSFVATLVVPLVADAHARGDADAARDRTCDALFLRSCARARARACALVGSPPPPFSSSVAPLALTSLGRIHARAARSGCSARWRSRARRRAACGSCCRRVVCTAV